MKLKEVQQQRLENESETDRLARLEKAKQGQQQHLENESKTEQLSRLEKLKQVQQQCLEDESEADHLTRLERQKQHQQHHRRQFLQNQIENHRLSHGTIQNQHQQMPVTENLPTISKYIETEEPLWTAFSHSMKTTISPNELDLNQTINYPLLNHFHQANVCLVCDRFMTSTADIKWNHKQTLLEHGRRLQDSEVTEPVKQCYKVFDEDLKHLILSPRARSTTEDNYCCCWQCYRSLRRDRKNKCPPKFATSNKWAIGELLAQIMIWLWK